MANCLVTKLKSSVSNVDLDRLGELNFILNFPNANESFLYRVTGSPTICSKDAPTSVNATVNAGVPFNTPQYSATIKGFSSGDLEIRNTDLYNLGTIFFSSTDTFTVVKPIKLSVLSKSTCTELNAVNMHLVEGDLSELPTTITEFAVGYTGNQITGDVESFNRLTSLARVNVGGSTIYGSLDSLTLTSLVDFELHSAKVTGNVTSLAKNLGLTHVAIQESIGIKGTIDDFAAEQVRLTRASGTCRFVSVSAVQNTIKYGSSMVSPTEAETAQGYQIV